MVEAAEEDQRSVDERIELFRSASMVASPHGSGLNNIIWCDPGTKVLEFFPGGYTSPHFCFICVALQMQHACNG
jgi:capsular polysaccharide biosynthesis protein